MLYSGSGYACLVEYCLRPFLLCLLLYNLFELFSVYGIVCSIAFYVCSSTVLPRMFSAYVNLYVVFEFVLHVFTQPCRGLVYFCGSFCLQMNGVPSCHVTQKRLRPKNYIHFSYVCPGNFSFLALGLFQTKSSVIYNCK